MMTAGSDLDKPSSITKTSISLKKKQKIVKTTQIFWSILGSYKQASRPWFFLFIWMIGQRFDLVAMDGG